MLGFFNKNRKWNISILVIFVLLASSVIGILTMNFVKQLMNYTESVYSYNKAYYHSKAWMELSLVQMDNLWLWFSRNIWSWNNEIFTSNFDCDYCGFEIDIEGKSKIWSKNFWNQDTCELSNALFLEDGASLILPMFSQVDHDSVYDSLITWEIYDKNIFLYRDYLKFYTKNDFQWDFNVWLFFVSNNDVQRDLLFLKSYEASEDLFEQYFGDYDNYYNNLDINNLDYLAYLLLTNVSGEEQYFCIGMDDINVWWIEKNILITTDKIFVSSRWFFKDKVVGLKWIYSQSIPDFFINTY